MFSTMVAMSENTSNQPLTQQPNSDIVNLPHSGPRDVQEGVEPLTPEQQVRQLSDFFEDNYPELFTSLTTDEGREYTSQGQEVPAELKEHTERLWAKIPDLMTHSSLLVLGAGLDHAMPHTAFIKTGPSAEPAQIPGLPDGVRATVLTPSAPTGAVAVSLHGGPGWFGDGMSHDQLWLPLFAALAERSGVTIVDLIYPLPGAGSWEPTQAAVAEAVRAVAAAKSELVDNPGSMGLVTFGTGFVAAQPVLSEVDFHLVMTPRIPEGFAGDVAGCATLVSLAQQDTRGTSVGDVKAWFDAQGADYEYRDYPSEHLIAAPAVWRERVADAAEWLSQR